MFVFEVVTTTRLLIDACNPTWCPDWHGTDFDGRAIRSGRFARDGGEESIYRDTAAMQLQAEKRAINKDVGDGSHNGGMLRDLSHAANDRTDILAVATPPTPGSNVAASEPAERLKTIGK